MCVTVLVVLFLSGFYVLRLFSLPLPWPQLSEKLRFYDPQLKEKPEQELFIEPEWLLHLRQLDGQIRVGSVK